MPELQAGIRRVQRKEPLSGRAALPRPRVKNTGPLARTDDKRTIENEKEATLKREGADGDLV